MTNRTKNINRRKRNEHARRRMWNALTTKDKIAHAIKLRDINTDKDTTND